MTTLVRLALVAVLAVAGISPHGPSAVAQIAIPPSAAAPAPDGDSAESDDEQEDTDADSEDPGAESEERTDAHQNEDEAAADDGPADENSEEAESDADAESAEKKKLDLYTVEAKDLTIAIELDGVFVADEMEEVSLRPETWSAFKVVRSVRHGQRVSEGETLVEFEDEDIEEAIAERSLQQHIGEIALKQAEEDFPRVEKATELEYQLAKRAYEQDQDEYERFQETMRELSEKLADYYLKSAQQDLDNAREELDQLQKMYEADELTEESEEIVLKRQKFQVEVAEFSLEYSKINHDYTMEVAIPQREELLQAAVERSRLALERAKMNRSLGLSKERYELEALREARARGAAAHAKLVADRALMTLRAPRDGLAYYGRCVNGRWMEVGSMETKLAPFGTVSPNTVVMTIVQRLPMHVETAVGEKEFPLVDAGQEVTVKPLADAEAELDATVRRIDAAPGSGNKFAVRIKLKSDAEPPKWLMPGMTCKAAIEVYKAENAVVIPADLVQKDKDDAVATYVMVLEEDGDEPERRNVKLGKSKDKEVEVVDGLAAGDRIVKGATDDAASESDD